MSKRMTSETIIFDTNWLTEADFGDKPNLTVSIDYRAYDTLKIIVNVPSVDLSLPGGAFQEFDVYKLENFGPYYQTLLAEGSDSFEIQHIKGEGYFKLIFFITKNYWETYLEGFASIYIKGVKR